MAALRGSLPWLSLQAAVCCCSSCLHLVTSIQGWQKKRRWTNSVFLHHDWELFHSNSKKTLRKSQIWSCWLSELSHDQRLISHLSTCAGFLGTSFWRINKWAITEQNCKSKLPSCKTVTPIIRCEGVTTRLNTLKQSWSVSRTYTHSPVSAGKPSTSPSLL